MVFCICRRLSKERNFNDRAGAEDALHGGNWRATKVECVLTERPSGTVAGPTVRLQSLGSSTERREDHVQNPIRVEG